MSQALQYHPIHLDGLVLHSVLSFNLYRKNSTGTYILYREQNLPFTPSHRDRLLENEIHELYISDMDKASYGKYVEQNIGKIVSDPAVPSERKAELIYSVSKGILLDAFENPRSSDILRRTEQVTAPTVDFLLKGREALHNLISLMSYDYYTFTHSVNVSVFTVALANQVGILNRGELNELAKGAMLHDIGKSEIPKEILNKTGVLSPEEMEIMKQHVQIGEVILSENGGISKSAMLVVSQHHEKINGQGYPRSLSDQEIHLYGRIAAIVDCYDAMTTNRSYQRAMEAFQALSLMKGKLQTHFDQNVLDKFIMLLKSNN